MKIHAYNDSWFRRISRSGGGLFLGVRFSFPTSIYDGPDEAYEGHVPTNARFKQCVLSIGFVAWTLTIAIDYDIKRLTP